MTLANVRRSARTLDRMAALLIGVQRMSAPGAGPMAPKGNGNVTMCLETAAKQVVSWRAWTAGWTVDSPALLAPQRLRAAAGDPGCQRAKKTESVMVPPLGRQDHPAWSL